MGAIRNRVVPICVFKAARSESLITKNKIGREKLKTELVKNEVFGRMNYLRGIK